MKHSLAGDTQRTKGVANPAQARAGADQQSILETETEKEGGAEMRRPLAKIEGSNLFRSDAAEL
jgi:hypothetical protein